MDESDFRMEDDYCDDGCDTCTDCNGEGHILICIDDICHGQGFCMHGDGEEICKTCNGNGYVC